MGWFSIILQNPHVKENSGSRVMAQNVSTNQMAGIPHVTIVEIGPQNMKWPNMKCTKWKWSNGVLQLLNFSLHKMKSFNLHIFVNVENFKFLETPGERGTPGQIF